MVRYYGYYRNVSRGNGRRKAAMTLSSAFSNHWGMRPFARAGAPNPKDMLAFNAYSSALKDVSYC